MGQFVKITLATEGGNHLKKWIDIDTIAELSQNSQEQWPNNEGTIVFTDGATVDVISFNETIDALN
jgi:hypothetical protein